MTTLEVNVMMTAFCPRTPNDEGNLEVPIKNYEINAEDDVPTEMLLGPAFEAGQNEFLNEVRPGPEKLPSVSAGDIILIRSRWFLCKYFGWMELTVEQVGKWMMMDPRECQARIFSTPTGDPFAVEVDQSQIESGKLLFFGGEGEVSTDQ